MDIIENIVSRLRRPSGTQEEISPAAAAAFIEANRPRRCECSGPSCQFMVQLNENLRLAKSEPDVNRVQ